MNRMRNELRRVQDVFGQAGSTPDTALRLAAFFGGDTNSWLNRQQAYDLKSVDKQIVQRILKEIQPLEPA